MSIIHSLNSFSLPELFKLIEHDSKSGRLIVETPLSDRSNQRAGIYYLWFKDGYLIAISNCINQKGLIDLIAQRDWLSPIVVARLRKLCPTGVPLGIYLRQMKLLDSKKISLIFQLQLHQVYRLFQLHEGRFRFDDFAELQDRILTIPWLEMTGHRIKTIEVSMYALRLIENSDNFNDRLPSLSQALRKNVICSHLKLNTIERELWDLADSKTPLLTIAKMIDYSIPQIRATAFRLITVGLVDAVFVPGQDWSDKSNRPTHNSTNKPLDNSIALQSRVEKNHLSPEAISVRQTSLLETLGSLFKKKA